MPEIAFWAELLLSCSQGFFFCAFSLIPDDAAMGRNIMRIAIIGSGAVGSTIAYSIVNQGLASVLVMIDHQPGKAEGEAMDLQHCASFVPPVDIISGDITTARAMDIIIITAGVKRRPEELRTDLIKRNIEVFEQIAGPLAGDNPEAIFIIVSNPVDLLTLYMLQHSGLNPRQIIGSGTLLDTSRLRFLLSENFSVDPRNVHAYVVGEHGEGSIVLWSQAYVASIPIDEFARQTGVAFGSVQKAELLQAMLSAGQEVIRRKGATYFGIAQSVLRILTAISRDETSVLTVSTDLKGFEGYHNLALSVPAIISRGGVKRVLKPTLSSEESHQFKEVAEKIKTMAAESGIVS
jgi:L-lactate dehydrogenase